MSTLPVSDVLDQLRAALSQYDDVVLEFLLTDVYELLDFFLKLRM